MMTSKEILLNLRKFNLLSKAQQRNCILFAEYSEFNIEEEKEIALILLDYIKTFEIKEDRDVTVICSAIRTCISSLEKKDIWKITELLEPSISIKLEIQLEIIKMIARYFKVIRQPLSTERLEVRLFDIAKAHLNPFVINGKYHSTIAIEAILALVFLRSPLTCILIRDLESLPKNCSWMLTALKSDCKKDLDRIKESCFNTKLSLELDVCLR